MHKKEATKKEIQRWYPIIIEVGYCDLQNMLVYESPVFYNAGKYGWNFDIYDFGNVAICTGERPFGTIHANHDTVRAFESLAIELREGFVPDQNYDSKVNVLHALCRDFIKAVLDENKVESEVCEYGA